MTRRRTLVIYEAANALKALIDSNPLSKESNTELLNHFHVGSNQIREVFKEITGKTIKHYRLVRKMETACDFLLEGKLTIKEVAIKVGYRKYHNNFSRDFKIVFNTSPEEWLRNHLNKV